MQSSSKKITQAVIELFILTFLTLLPVVSIYLDVVILGNNVGEVSVTEFTQEGLLLIAAIIFWYGAWKKPAIRGFLVLVAGFFSCMFIREMDAFLDNVWHGFWFWPALVVALVVIFYARLIAKNTTQKPLTDFINTWIQLASATACNSSNNTSFGVFIPSVFLGRLFKRCIMNSKCSSSKCLKHEPLGQY